LRIEETQNSILRIVFSCKFNLIGEKWKKCDSSRKTKMFSSFTLENRINIIG